MTSPRSLELEHRCESGGTDVEELTTKIEGTANAFGDMKKLPAPSSVMFRVCGTLMTTRRLDQHCNARLSHACCYNVRRRVKIYVRLSIYVHQVVQWPHYEYGTVRCLEYVPCGTNTYLYGYTFAGNCLILATSCGVCSEPERAIGPRIVLSR
jgi:hypothetical protein